MEEPKYMLAKENSQGEIVDVESDEEGDRYVYLETDASGNITKKRYLSNECGDKIRDEEHKIVLGAYHPDDHSSMVIREKPSEPIPPKEKVIKPLANRKAVKKKSHWTKMKEAIFGEDVRSIPEFIIYDLLIPNAKRLFMDMVNSALGIAFFGDSNARKKNDNRTHVSMSSVYDDRNSSRNNSSGRSRVRSKLSDLVFDSKSDAEYVLEQLMDLVEMYGSVSMQDLYYITGQEAAYTDANYGWTNLRGACVVACMDGYTLSLPPVKALV